MGMMGQKQLGNIKSFMRIMVRTLYETQEARFTNFPLIRDV